MYNTVITETQESLSLNFYDKVIAVDGEGAEFIVAEFYADLTACCTIGYRMDIRHKGLYNAHNKTVQTKWLEFVSKIQANAQEQGILV